MTNYQRLDWQNSRDGATMSVLRVHMDVSDDGRLTATAMPVRHLEVVREWDTDTDWETGRWELWETLNGNHVRVSVHKTKREAKEAGESRVRG